MRRNRIRIAAWGAILAMALHALSPLAAPAPRAGASSLHDFCTSAPAAPQPAGDPSTSHCALCVQPASMSPKPFVAFQDAGVSFFVPEFFLPEPIPRLTSPHSARAPPAGA
jgi:hypothetical protein